MLHAAGLRSLGLVWSRPNAFATGVSFAFPGTPDEGPGLTERGRALVRACAERGILVDLSHLNERGFWDVAALEHGPLVASHSGAHALCPSPRNLTDEQLRAIGASGGLVGINFHVGFVRADGAEDPDTPLARDRRRTPRTSRRSPASRRSRSAPTSTARRCRASCRTSPRCPRLHAALAEAGFAARGARADRPRELAPGAGGHVAT